MVKPTHNPPRDRRDDAVVARDWLDALPPDRYPREDRQRLAQACDMLVHSRADQALETGETRVRRLLCTADILAQLRMDADTLIATLLSGCPECPEIGEEQLAARFGPGILSMVKDLDRIHRLVAEDVVVAAEDQHEENLRRLLLDIVKDPRVVLIVLGARLHLMRNMDKLSDTQRREIARSARHIYAPLANRLGVWQIKWELEDLAMRCLEPDAYKQIAKQLDSRRAEREAFVGETIATLKTRFVEAGIAADISGRPKHIYSIWRKMQRKNLGIEQIFDLQAIRVLVQDIASCYAALGVVHGLWQHIPKEFDDYITTPKGNMYQSLHTAVIGPEDKPLEVQIRTWDMHRHAELGVAAHWAYKENKQHDAAFQRWMAPMRRWMVPVRNRLKLKQSEDKDAPVEQPQLEPAHVYVLTPQSKVIALPRGATALDFAYAIHSEVGNRCRGAKVDGNIVPLNQPLVSGQTVEILTRKNAMPSRDWLDRGYLKTTKARNRVRQWFKRQDFDHDLEAGRSLLEKERRRLRIEAKPQLDQICRRYNFRREEDLVAAVGRGEIAAGQIARLAGEPETTGHDKPPPPPSSKEGIPDRAEVIVEGVTDLMTYMAQCCKPIPHDKIIGFITRGNGVAIHRRACVNVSNLPEQEKGRLIRVRWANQPVETAYPVDLVIIADDRKGLLRDISSVFTDRGIQVVGTNSTSDRFKEIATMRFTVELKDVAQLGQLLAKLRQIPSVLEVKRPH